jgi:hypothetical protein
MRGTEFQKNFDINRFLSSKEKHKLKLHSPEAPPSRDIPLKVAFFH